ncbi:peptidyl-prolyl cis-trans isomerase Fpr2p [Diutina catenulata]
MKFLTILTAIAAVVAEVTDLEIDITKKVPAAACKRKAKDGDTVSVHYAGRLEDGTQFDASYDRGQPISFVLGEGRVIQGWEQGIQGMCVGEKRKLTIPPHLGYGSAGVGPIPANSVLIFDTELVDIAGGYDDEEEEEEQNLQAEDMLEANAEFKDEL